MQWEEAGGAVLSLQSELWPPSSVLLGRRRPQKITGDTPSLEPEGTSAS